MAQRAKAKISKLRIEKARAIVFLDGVRSPANDGWWVLPTDHPTFQQCVAMLLSAAINRQGVILKPEDEPNHHKIKYVEQVWTT